MHPLTCTWSPHIYTDWGWKNLQLWIKAGFDNILFTPNGKVHRLITRLAVENLFHPFQPFILGQKNVAPKIAEKYDIPLIFNITSKLDIPVIACGGVGDYNHFKEGIEEGGASAVAAGNIFNFRELAYPLAKKYLKKNQLNFR